ncbi:hypothetical protein MTsPCn9_24670 [Croceitalea sp. MTPC9]|uniref:hypothetical protein n=1 Tax=unclassified Croceitalea TaxID=2632280 RepID=UPI002B395B7A|nr:hypothetical protein MTsPCn6_18860 [Croceitalea sp. MTPC6]GMN17529.1 hypothetical protein MTsPCn9_24670 [Croceitalea sp. MTPC9]
MEKLEKHIKEKLEERKISPSNEAWQQIESSLGAQAEKKRKGTYWYAIAASIVGLLVISVMYFNNQKAIEIVDIENTQENDLKSIEKAGVIESSKKENIPQVDKETHVVNSETNFVKEKAIKDEKRLIAAIPKSKEKSTLKDSFVTTKAENLIIDKKVEEVLATVINLESTANQVTDAEIDSLLRTAQQEVLKERLFQEDGKVDATALLNEVETEIDQSFRNKIFEKLKQGFIKARTAVADRNN